MKNSLINEEFNFWTTELDEKEIFEIIKRNYLLFLSNNNLRLIFTKAFSHLPINVLSSQSILIHNDLIIDDRFIFSEELNWNENKIKQIYDSILNVLISKLISHNAKNTIYFNYYLMIFNYLLIYHLNKDNELNEYRICNILSDFSTYNVSEMVITKDELITSLAVYHLTWNDLMTYCHLFFYNTLNELSLSKKYQYSKYNFYLTTKDTKTLILAKDSVLNALSTINLTLNNEYGKLSFKILCEEQTLMQYDFNHENLTTPMQIKLQVDIKQIKCDFYAKQVNHKTLHLTKSWELDVSNNETALTKNEIWTQNASLYYQYFLSHHDYLFGNLFKKMYELNPSDSRLYDMIFSYNVLLALNELNPNFFINLTFLKNNSLKPKQPNLLTYNSNEIDDYLFDGYNNLVVKRLKKKYKKQIKKLKLWLKEYQ